VRDADLVSGSEEAVNDDAERRSRGADDVHLRQFQQVRDEAAEIGRVETASVVVVLKLGQQRLSACDYHLRRTDVTHQVLPHTYTQHSVSFTSSAAPVTTGIESADHCQRYDPKAYVFCIHPRLYFTWSFFWMIPSAFVNKFTCIDIMYS